MNELTQDTYLLKKLYKRSREVKERERYQALYFYALGYTRKEIGELFFKDEETIAAWVNKWLDENDPTNGKVNCAIVDCAHLQNYIQKKYGIEISDEAI